MQTIAKYANKQTSKPILTEITSLTLSIAVGYKTGWVKHLFTIIY